MDALTVGFVVLACTFGGVLAGMKLSAMLPEHHLTGESKDTVKVGIGLIATMTALILGLVTAAAKSSFDALDTTVKHAAIDLLTLDRVLARYGPETAPIREGLKSAAAHRFERIWGRDESQEVRFNPLDAVGGGELLSAQISALVPKTEEQRSLQSRATDLAEALLATRWSVVNALGTSVPVPFLSILLFWLTITFGSFGLFAPRNVTTVSVLFLCSLSVAGAVFLVLEMDRPFDGFIEVSAEPLKYAISHLNR